MEFNSKVPQKYYSSGPAASPEGKQNQENSESSFQRTIPKQKGAPNKLLAQRFKAPEVKADPIINRMDELNVELQELNFWADNILQNEGQVNSDSAEESSDSGGANVLKSSVCADKGEEPRPDPQNERMEADRDVRVATTDGGFYKANARPSDRRKLMNVITKRTPSRSTPRRGIELPSVDSRLLSPLDRKRRAFANKKTQEAEQHLIRKNLPPGLIFDTDGNINGKYSFTKFSSPGKERIMLEDVFSDRMTQFLNPGSTKILPPKPVAGVTVIDPCAADFHRLNYEFVTREGKMKELPWPDDQQAEQYRTGINKPDLAIKTCKEHLRASQIATSLQEFVKNDNASEEENGRAALVLSAVLAQQTSMLLVNVVYGPTSPLKMLSSQSTAEVGRAMTIKDRRGEEHHVDVKAFGATVFTLSSDGDNFKVAVDFPWFAEAREGREAELPLHKNGVISVHTRAEILVDAEKARAGILSVRFLNGIQAEYSGRLNFELNQTAV
ncbi:hypothetical protein [Variovorax soli]|uniref:Uncharacterized protein n=1 Tax=Variovorax soli TaxID=376815 RepID=A0ABU1NI72_9BURK|nr:hypothetical protein [Variovorax soli]MDR6537720.1 hypothetical protein [Variovorax soli]